LAYLSYEDVKDYIGNPYEIAEDERLQTYHSKEHQPEPILVFLGADESQSTPLIDAPGREIAEKYPGVAYFSIDVTPDNQSEKYKKGAQDILDRAKEKGYQVLTVRIGVSLSDKEAPIVAMARSFTDWNVRNVVLCSY
jgi:NADH pyrophosphatase-like rudimentary NUDIX domain